MLGDTSTFGFYTTYFNDQRLMGLKAISLSPKFLDKEPVTLLAPFQRDGGGKESCILKTAIDLLSFVLYCQSELLKVIQYFEFIENMADWNQCWSSSRFDARFVSSDHCVFVRLLCAAFSS